MSVKLAIPCEPAPGSTSSATRLQPSEMPAILGKAHVAQLANQAGESHATQIANDTDETSVTCQRQSKVANGADDLHAIYVKNSLMQKIVSKEHHLQK